MSTSGDVQLDNEIGKKDKYKAIPIVQDIMEQI